MKKTAAVITAIIAVLALMFIATEQTTPPEMTEAEIAQNEAEAKQAITDRLNAYENVAVNNDLEGQLSYWTPDIRFMEPGMDLSGDEWSSYLREFQESGGKVLSWGWDPIEIFVHGDVAYQIARYHESFQIPGGEPIEAHNNYFARWERQPDGVWRLSRVVAGPIDAPPEG